MHGGLDVRGRRAREVLDSHPDPHRAHDRLKDGIHGDVRIRLGEQGDPALLTLAVQGRWPEDLVDEGDQGVALLLVRQQGLEPVGGCPDCRPRDP